MSVKKFDLMYKDLKLLRPVFQTHPEKKVEEEEKVFDAFIHSHGFSLVVPPPRLLNLDSLPSTDSTFLQNGGRYGHSLRLVKQTSLFYLFPLAEGASLLASLPCILLFFPKPAPRPLDGSVQKWLQTLMVPRRSMTFPLATAKYIAVHVHGKSH